MAKRTLEQQKADLDRKIARVRHHDEARVMIDQLKSILHARDYRAVHDLAEVLRKHAAALIDLQAAGNTPNTGDAFRDVLGVGASS